MKILHQMVEKKQNLHHVVVFPKAASHDEVHRVCHEVDEDFKNLEE